MIVNKLSLKKIIGIQLNGGNKLMKDREEIEKEIITSTSKNILVQFPTGCRKTRIALDRMGVWIYPNIGTKILIVVPRIVLIQNWIDEFKKWGYENYLNFTEFVTYASLHKKVGDYNLIIFDEVHHLSERCREVLNYFYPKNTIMLSATVSRDMKRELYNIFPDMRIYSLSIKEAINNDMLPDPKVILIPLKLDDKTKNCQIIKNKEKTFQITIPYSERKKYFNEKRFKIIIECTQKEFYNDISNLIEYYKKKMFFNERLKNMYLRKCGERLKWLSDQKTSIIKEILVKLNNERTLTFCNSILQTELLGEYCINSKNKESKEYLKMFNEGKINHITACNILDEGVNLSNCKVGIYASLNNSERIIIQRLGRLLRHQKPVLIIPYFEGTRDEEIINKMLLNYNDDLITKVKSLNFKL